MSTDTDPIGKEAATANPAPSFAERFRLANERLRAGEVAGAAADYAALLELRPESGELLCKLADARDRLGQRDEAFRLLARAVEVNEGLIWAHIGLARLHVATGNHAAATLALERAMQCRTVPPSAPLELTRQLLRAARAALRALESDVAEQRFQQALAYAGADPALEVLVRSDLANLLADEGRFEGAIAVLQPVAGRAPQNLQALRDRAAHAGPERILVADGREDAAGRALALLAALRHAAPDLGRIRVRFVNVEDQRVRTMIATLAWDTGIAVEVTEDGAEAALAGCSGFLAMVRRAADHLTPFRRVAAERGIPALVAIRDCTAADPAEAWVLARDARDPQHFARRIAGLFPA